MLQRKHGSNTIPTGPVFLIKVAISKAGYRVLEIEAEEEVDEERQRREKEIRELFSKFIFSAAFTIPLSYIAMGHMIGLPLPEALEPSTHPLNFALIQLVLTIPVVIAGNKFYTVGFRSLIKISPNMDYLIAIGTSAAIIYGWCGVILWM